jgi:hypothetical protein
MKFSAFLIFLGVCVGALGGAAGLHAQDRDECSDRIRKDRRDLARAIDEHGYYSSQARHERGELQRDAQRCGYSDYDGDDRETIGAATATGNTTMTGKEAMGTPLLILGIGTA